jgi:hypothetical protein
MAVTLSTGTTLSASASLPATFDGTGYGALSFTEIGEVQEVGEFGKSYNIVSHQTVGQPYPSKSKGVYDVDDISITLAMDDSDSGQGLLATALDASASYSFQVTTPDTVDRYFTAKVSSVKKGSFSGDAVINATVTLTVDPESMVEV